MKKRIERCLNLALVIEAIIVCWLGSVILAIQTGLMTQWQSLKAENPILWVLSIFSFGVPIGVMAARVIVWFFPNPSDLFQERKNQENKR